MLHKTLLTHSSHSQQENRTDLTVCFKLLLLFLQILIHAHQRSQFLKKTVGQHDIHTNISLCHIADTHYTVKHIVNGERFAG